MGISKGVLGDEHSHVVIEMVDTQQTGTRARDGRVSEASLGQILKIHPYPDGQTPWHRDSKGRHVERSCIRHVEMGHDPGELEGFGV